MGYAVRYDEVVSKGASRGILLPGAFNDTLKSRATVKLLRNHQESECIGSTDDGLLELADDGRTGLAFRVADFPNTPLGKSVRWMTTETQCDSVSVCYDNAEMFVSQIDGENVFHIVKARLVEVSLMSIYDHCACKGSFVVYGDFDDLQQEMRSGRLAREGAAIQFRRAIRRYEIARFAEAQKPNIR